MPDTFRDNGNDMGEGLELKRLSGRKLGRKAMENSVVSMDNAGISRKRRRRRGFGGGEGGKERVVPVLVESENSRLGIILNFNNEGSGQVICRRRRRRRNKR